MAHHKQPSSSMENQELATERFDFNTEDDDFQEPSMVWCLNSGCFLLSNIKYDKWLLRYLKLLNIVL